jgi:Putative zinc-finger
MSHLGDRIPALVDGELGHEARDRTLAHLAGCAECRAEVELERQTKALLARLNTPEPSSELMRGLLTLAEPGPPLPPSRRPFPRGDRPPTLTAPSRRRPPGAPAEGRRPTGRSHRRLRVITVGALSGFAIVMGTAFVAGGQPEEPGAPLTPPIDRYRVEHAATTGGVPFVDPAYATFSGAFQPAFTTVPSQGPAAGFGWTGASTSGVPSR